MKRGRDGKTELERAREHSGGPDSDKSFPFEAYRDEEVRQRLEELFHGKCAYCEQFYRSGAPVDIEHFRPKGRVKGEAHPGYWWLAMAWDNLLPSCIDCNRRRYQSIPAGSPSLAQLNESSASLSGAALMLSGKQDAFPISGTRALPEASTFESERALLLDPCRDDPAEHLMFYLDRNNPVALVLPRRTREGGQDVLPDRGGDFAAIAAKAHAVGLSARGAVSIQIYGLNRLGLVQERTRLLRQLEFLGDLTLELAALADELEKAAHPCPGHPEVVSRLRLLAERTLQEILGMCDERAPHSQLARQWTAHFQARLGA